MTKFSTPSFFAKLKRLIWFILFIEDEPKHRVKVDLSPLECVFLGLVSAMCSLFFGALFLSLNIIEFLTMFSLFVIGVLECFHFALDW